LLAGHGCRAASTFNGGTPHGNPAAAGFRPRQILCACGRAPCDKQWVTGTGDIHRPLDDAEVRGIVDDDRRDQAVRAAQPVEIEAQQWVTVRTV
jgi:hypothetical protein